MIKHSYSINIVFQAYLRWLKNNGDRTVKLQGIDATDKQLFFLAFGQVSIEIFLRKLHFFNMSKNVLGFRINLTAILFL